MPASLSIVPVLLPSLYLFGASAAPASAPDEVFFEERIRPLLVEHCGACCSNLCARARGKTCFHLLVLAILLLTRQLSHFWWLEQARLAGLVRIVGYSAS